MQEEIKKEKLVEEIETEPASDNKVLVDKVTLDNILERLSNIESVNPVRRAAKVGNHTARVRLVEGKVVKGYGKTWDKMVVGVGKVAMIEVVDIDGTVHEMEHLKFIDTGECLESEILSVAKSEHEKILGTVNPTKVDYENFRAEVLDQTVPLKVVSVEYTYKLKLPDGTEVSLPADALN